MNKPYGVEDASFRAAGKETGVQQLVKDFYRLMDTNPDYTELRDLHSSNIKLSEDKLAVFLIGWLGGPRLYRDKYGPISIPMVHQHLNITRETVEQWLVCMSQAIDLQSFSSEFSEYLIAQLRVPAERILAVIDAKQATRNI